LFWKFEEAKIIEDDILDGRRVGVGDCVV